MRLFWRHGFDGVTFKQLTTELNLAPPSLYAAFGNKEALYREALQHYLDVRGTNDLSFMNGCESLHDAIQALLNRTAEALLASSQELGCMLMIGMVTTHPEHTELARDVARERTAFIALLADRLRKWASDEKGADFARYLAAVLQGMTVQARDGANRAELQAIINSVLEGLSGPPVVKVRRKRGNNTSSGAASEAEPSSDK